MRAHLIVDGVIVNTVVVDSLDALPGLIAESPGFGIGDRYADGVFTKAPPEPVAVPESVTRRQARQALLLAGLLDAVPAAIAAIPDATQRQLAQIEWEDSLQFERSRPLLIALATALGLTSAQLDQLFISASAL